MKIATIRLAEEHIDNYSDFMDSNVDDNDDMEECKTSHQFHERLHDKNGSWELDIVYKTYEYICHKISQ